MKTFILAAALAISLTASVVAHAQSLPAAPHAERPGHPQGIGPEEKFEDHKARLLQGLDSARTCVANAMSREALQNCRPHRPEGPRPGAPGFEPDARPARRDR